MHPAIREIMVRDNQRELDRNVRNAYLLHGSREVAAPPVESVVLRLSCVQDDDALDRLAQLESRPAPKGQHVVAEVRGVIVAALPLGPGSALADPFRRTTHLVPLLELRASQLTTNRARWRSQAVWRTVRVAARRGG